MKKITRNSRTLRSELFLYRYPVIRMTCVHLIFLIIIFLSGCISNGKNEGVDYTINNAEFPDAILNVADTITIPFTAVNRGDIGGSMNFTIQMCLSPTYYFDENSAVYLDEIITDHPLQSGETWSSGITVTLPSNSPRYSYFFLKIVSSEVESEIGNNAVSSGGYSVTGGIINRTELPVDDTYHSHSITAYTLEYYFFNAVLGHAYLINWDDRYEGVTYFSTGADILVSAKWEDNTTTYFTEVDSGYTYYSTVSVQNNGMVFLDIKSLAVSGEYAIKISDFGIPPDLTVTLDSHYYNGGNGTLDLTYTVRNQAAVSTGSVCFYTGFWIDLSSPPTINDVADYYINNCQDIPGGGQVTLTETIPSSVSTGTAYAIVDVYDDMVEGNETNNVTLPYSW